MTISLPQNTSAADQRNREQQLERIRANYQYTYTLFKEISPELEYPMAEKVQPQDQTIYKWSWTRDAIDILLRILSNQAIQDVSIKGGKACRLITLLRFTRLLRNPEKSTTLETLFYKLLSLAECIRRLRGQKAESEDIKQDITETKQVERVEASISSMVQEIEAAIPLQPKSSDPETRLTFRDYQQLFQVIYLPCISQHVLEDRAFAAQRVAGANPLMIKRVITSLPDNFPVTDTHYQAVMGADDSLSQAISEGRLYLTDYKVLEEIDPSNFPVGQKYLCAPLALFAIPTGDCPGRLLTAVAIQCHQTPAADNPIFTPPTQSQSSDYWAWQMAKLTVQIADGNYHELISHLGRTHLLIEPIAITTHRQLAPNHPLSVLLLPHFEGTLYINNAAIGGLINPKGTVDKVLAGELASSVTLSAKGAKGFPYTFNESMLPHILAKQGVNDAKMLPDYPYRDDATLIWQAIHAWVDEYLRLYYSSDQDVFNDTELQAWLSELIAPDGGQMTGIGETTPADPNPKMRTLAYLVNATTLIIFTGSVQHAAVNFPQATLMTYMPNMPLAGYRPAPQSTTGMGEADYFDLLPSLDQAETQMAMTYLLGSVYFTQLGQYKRNDDDPEDENRKDYFEDDRVAKPLQTFQQRLADIEVTIQKRNETRPTFYDVLRPSKIPQSINI